VIRKAQAQVFLEADTVAKTLHLVIEVNAADGLGDVVVHRVDLSAGLAGPANSAKRAALRDVFTDEQ
jgi:hypothetical protein